MHADIQLVKEKVGEKAEMIHRIQSELSKAIVGQEIMVSRLLVGLLTEGHVKEPAESFSRKIQSA